MLKSVEFCRSSSESNPFAAEDIHKVERWNLDVRPRLPAFNELWHVQTSETTILVMFHISILESWGKLPTVAMLAFL